VTLCDLADFNDTERRAASLRLPSF